MSGPFFSIILPSFNRAEQLMKAIDSVLGQTFTDFEVIIVDDGSTDNTKESIRALTDPRINYFYKKNEERSIARNFGITKARGNYVNFLDSDDYLYPNHLSVAYAKLSAGASPDVVLLGYAVHDREGRLLTTRNTFTPRISKEIIRENTITCNCIIVKREILKELIFLESPDAIISEDWYLWIRLAARFNFEVDNTITSIVIEHTGRSLNNLVGEKVEKSLLLVIKGLQEDQQVKHFYKGMFKRFVAWNYCFIASCFIIQGQRSKAWNYLVCAIKEYLLIVTTPLFLGVLRVLIGLRKIPSQNNG